MAKKGYIPWNKTNIFKTCLTCSKEFKTILSQMKLGRGKYCSQECFKKSRFGRHYSMEWKKNISLANKGKKWPSHRGENNGAWKGNDVTYSPLHKWVRYYLGKPKECVYCGEEFKRLTWASISHKAKRDIDDYIPLCVRCHSNYDRNYRKEVEFSWLQA